VAHSISGTPLFNVEDNQRKGWWAVGGKKKTAFEKTKKGSSRIIKNILKEDEMILREGTSITGGELPTQNTVPL